MAGLTYAVTANAMSELASLPLRSSDRVARLPCPELKKLASFSIHRQLYVIDGPRLARRWMSRVNRPSRFTQTIPTPATRYW